MNDSSYGSGYFGTWFIDEHGLPAYRYTCDQTRDERAVTPVNEVWRGATDHSHQVGNDRVVGVASNYGYVQLRQDEGSPKFLNDYDAAAQQYGGGIGYLTDGDTSVSTYFTGDTDRFKRVFGVGYLRKTVSNGDYEVDQVIFAPFGDDPLLISQVTITNDSDRQAALRWVEYWGCKQYQFSNRASMQGRTVGDITMVPRLRREFAAQFEHAVAAHDTGLLDTQRFTERSEEDKRLWDTVQRDLEEGGYFRGRVREPVPEAYLEDLCPPPVFLISLDAPPDSYSGAAARFFGSGGVEQPDGLQAPLDRDLSVRDAGAGLLLERQFSLAPGESKTLTFAYGYLHGSTTLSDLTDKYGVNLDQHWALSSKQWKEDGLRLEVGEEDDWVGRELVWHNYYLRSNLTFDSFFGEHIESQGHVYQYVTGFQGAARDQLQHALPFTFTQPWIVRETIRYTLKEMAPDGEIPWAIVGHGMWMYAKYRPSDLHLWLLWLAAEYVLATRDLDFLEEEVPLYPVYGSDVQTGTVREHLSLAFRTFIDTVGVGKHQLVRLYNGDWNDSAVLGHAPPEMENEIRQRAESVLNAAMATYVMDIYAEMSHYAGDDALADEARRFSDGQRAAISKQWNGRWFKRAWMTETLGWLGEDQLWLEPQPWALIGGAADEAQTQEMLAALDELVRQPSPIGAMLHSKGVKAMRHGVGFLTNGGVWPSINGTLIWALALFDGERAWDEYKKNMLAVHAEAYPDIWYGIWSGPDSYNSVLSPFPGETQFHPKLRPEGPQDIKMSIHGMGWTDFPVMNMHPHAWPLYDVLKLLGLEFTAEGFVLAPSIPKDKYRFESPLLGLEKSEDGYSGWYAPPGAGEWTVQLRLAAEELETFSTVVVNERETPLEVSGEALTFRGRSTPEKAMRWSLRRSGMDQVLK